jgi:hypothetical protein
MSLTIQPPYHEWQAVLRSNQDAFIAARERLGKSRVLAVRNEALAIAKRYTDSLHALAKSCGIELPRYQMDSGPQSGPPIVMTGHQPIVYHPGLMRKEQTLAGFTRDTGAIGLHVIIDSDEGDGGALVWPRVSSGSIELKRASLVESKALDKKLIFCEQRLRSTEEIGEVFDELCADLVESGLHESDQRVRGISRLYQALAGQPVSAAHSIVRWAISGRSWCEAPLTDLVGSQGLREVVQDLVNDGERLGSCYNATLDSYRREHKIDNLANPFPNLKVSAEQIELPLWRVVNGVRVPVVWNRGENALAAGLVCPRGAITTMLLRGYCSDLFIHGLGGARYDRFVDEFAQDYLGVALPKFVVASETRYLFPDEVQAISERLELISNRKELIARTENFFGRGIFSEEEETRLHSIVSERNHLRTVIQGAQSPEERSGAAHALNATNRAVREIVEGGSLRQVIAEAPARQAALRQWSYREFPFFLFPV